MSDSGYYACICAAIGVLSAAEWAELSSREAGMISGLLDHALHRTTGGHVQAGRELFTSETITFQSTCRSC